MNTAGDTNLNPPVLPDEVRTLQEIIAAQAAVVESGEEPQPDFLGLISRKPKTLTPEERFALLQDLLGGCRNLHTHLISHRGVLLSFFTRLAAHLRELLAGKVNQVKELEYKRKKLSEVAENTQDEGLAAGVDELQQRLGRFLRIVCMGAILLLRSIERCRKALDLLEEEERRRQKMMESLTVRVNAHIQMRELEKELSDFEKKAGVGSDVRFDSYMRDYWVPFEDLVREVRSIDEKLRSAADEIVEFAKTLEAARPGDVPFASMDEIAVDHLLHAESDPSAIWNVVQDEAAMDQASAGVDVALAFGKEPSFDRALKNIETLVQSRLEDCFGDELNRARLANTPGAWAEYLARYPASAGAEESRLNLKKMEDEELAKARGASGAWDAVPLWRRFLEQFTDSPNAGEAQEAIFRLRAETLSQARTATTPHDARGAWHAFAVLFPDRTAEESREFQEGLHAALVRIEATPKRWREYLSVCPDGPLAREAKEFVDSYAWVPNWAVAWGMEWSLPNGRCWAELEVKGVRQRFRLIENTVFLMGSPAEEKRDQNETPQHEVTLTRPYWIAETECTQALWKAVTGTNPSKFQEDNRPVETVSWEDCLLFMNHLNELIPELEARLPTEAEWECACRAGTSGPYAGTGLWQEMAWASENAGGETHAVKQRQPNAWGLYDMHGNVAEWLSDDLRAYVHEKCIDPVGPPPAIKASHRGGSWNWGVTNTRSAARNSLYRDVRGPEQGLRIAVSASRNESGWVYCATGGPDLDRLSKPPDHGVFLGELKAQQVTGGYAPTVNDAWGVRSCLIAGRTCDTFVTVHPPGEFAWPIPTQSFQFTTVLARVDIVQTFHASWIYQFLIDGKVVFKSPPLSERRNGIPLVLDIPPGARRLTVITDPLGDNQHDHAILAWPYFRMRPALELLACIPEEAIFLGDLTFTKKHFGGLEFRSFKNSSSGDAVPIAGKPVTTYLDVHAPASITYEIPDRAHRFTAIGSRRDRDFTAQGTWKYEVWIDGVRVFDSVPFHEKPEGISIDVAIPEEARELTIKVDDFGDNYQDWSTLAYPCFHLADSAESVARRIGLKPGEVAFRTAERKWLCAMDKEDRIITVDNPLEPGVRLRWRWRGSSECFFALGLTAERFIRVASSGRVHLADPPDVENEYLTLVHADRGRFAIRPFGPYLTTRDGVVAATSNIIGPDESLEIVDPKYPPPPRPAMVDLKALAKEAVVYLNFDVLRVVDEKGGRILVDASGARNTRAVLHNALIQNGRAKKALAFNGIDASLELRLASPLNGSSLTIVFWIYYESYERNSNQAFWLSQMEAGRETISLCTSWGRLAWRRNGKEVALSRGEFQFRRWHHVAIVVEGTRNRLYIDGFLQMDGSCRPSPDSKSALWFGCSATSEPETFCNGMLEDLLILNRPLSPKEVRGIALE